MKTKTLLLVSTTLIGVTLLSNSFQLAKADTGAKENSLLEIPAGQAVPIIDIDMSKDATGIWKRKAIYFRFAKMLIDKITQARVMLIFT